MSDDKTQWEQIVSAIDAAEGEPDRHLDNQINRSLADAIRAAGQSGKPSTVTVKVKIASSVGGRVVCSATVEAKLPRPPVGAVTLFADGLGNLHSENPRQGTLAIIITTTKQEN